MTTLRTEQIAIPAASIGPENPLPFFRSPDPNGRVSVHDSVPEEDRRYMGWQTAFRVLPHRIQDSYSSDLQPVEMTVAVLENEHLRAAVLPAMGGRLISLFDRQNGVELLEPVSQIRIANIALRNAWIAGGVEWNTAHLGHHYLTCAPVFAARVTGHRGEPVLRLYAWERTKRFPYQIDLHLPPDSRFLFAHVRIINPHRTELPMYWWTNIAVPQENGRRTIAPADTAITNEPDGFALMELPQMNGTDITYGARVSFAREFFFRVDRQSRPWVASLNADGAGLVHASTARLSGRKMFVWGTSRGGRRWQEKLLEPGHAYLEIQGGLARTQFESIPMPPETEWTWTEAFGPMRVDPAKAHSDWHEAQTAVEAALEDMLPLARLNALDAELAAVTSRVPEEILARGDGWGSLELLRDDSAAPLALPFGPDAIGEDQQPWLTLLHEGRLPKRDVQQEPGHYMVQPEWRTLLEESIGRGASDHWLGWLHLGVMRLEDFDPDGAKAAWERSIELEPSAWAYRNLAVLANRRDDAGAACDLMARAWSIGPRVVSLALEFADLLEKAERWDALRELVADLPQNMRSHERILIVSAKLALRFGDMTGVEDILNHDFVTIREGEVTLTDLWFAWQAKIIADREGLAVDDELLARVRRELTPPSRIDMRMAVDV